MKKRDVITAVTSVLLLLVLILPVTVSAADDWKKEFDDVCSKTENSMSLSSEELKLLITRCDKLQTVIDTQDESTKKVFRKRLKLCRDLYDFVLKTRAQEKKDK